MADALLGLGGSLLHRELFGGGSGSGVLHR
jgi:hypothetical protein